VSASTRRTAAFSLALAIVVGACSNSPSQRAGTVSSATTSTSRTATSTGGTGGGVYAHTTSKDLAAAVRDDPALVYVPNSESDSVDVIDQHTFAIVQHFPVGKLPQHVTPSWDMRTLYVDNDLGNSLTPVDPRTGKVGTAIPVDDPYNLYFTPDGTSAIVVAEQRRRLDFRDPHTWAVTHSVPVPCNGVDHGDFTADGNVMVASCEFSGDLVRIDLKQFAVTGTLHVGGAPVDVKLSPDGSVFYVANQKRNGVSIIDVNSFTERSFTPTAAGTHGLYPSRDAKWLYATNRIAGSVSVLDFATGVVHDTWPIGGSPDMGNVTADGTQLWLSGRYNSEVYVVDTATGKLLHKIPVGKGPHGLCVWPQPGRYSIGHTGNTR
jgi:YVTN family beta-propeller protein